MKIYLKAAGAFLGLPKNGTRCAIVSEIGWLLPGARAKISKMRFLHRMMKMENNRITRKVFLWDKFLNNEKIVNTWYNEVKSILYETNFQYIHESNCQFPLRTTINAVQNSLRFIQNENCRIECNSMPKLKKIVLFKDFDREAGYLRKPLSFRQRKC